MNRGEILPPFGRQNDRSWDWYSTTFTFVWRLLLYTEKRVVVAFREPQCNNLLDQGEIPLKYGHSSTKNRPFDLAQDDNLRGVIF